MGIALKGTELLKTRRRRFNNVSVCTFLHCHVSIACVLCSPAYIHSNQIMGWGEKAIEIRSVETGHLDGVFMHKRAQRLKFLCERNDKVKHLKKKKKKKKGKQKCMILMINCS